MARVISQKSALLAAALFAVVTPLACATGPQDPIGPAGEHGDGAGETFGDLDLDPALLESLDSKADGDPCANYPGGPLGGDDLLALINKQPEQRLASDWSAPDLFPLEAEYVIPGRAAELRRAAQLAFMDLADAALQEHGFEVRVRSAYRSYQTQCFTFDYWVGVNGYEHAFRYSAQPGRSQHQLGTTIDVTIPALSWKLSADLALTPEGAWLAENATRFGFALSYPEGKEDVTGYGFEPWHFRYIGLEAAQELEAAHEILETYLQRCATTDPDLKCPREPVPTVAPNEGWIGGECEDPVDCVRVGASALCLTGPYDNGYCALRCDRSCPDLAGPNAVTFCVAQDNGRGLCHSRCDRELFPTTGCRDGYACQPARRPNGSGPMDVCLPVAVP